MPGGTTPRTGCGRANAIWTAKSGGQWTCRCGKRTRADLVARSGAVVSGPYDYRQQARNEADSLNIKGVTA